MTTTRANVTDTSHVARIGLAAIIAAGALVAGAAPAFAAEEKGKRRGLDEMLRELQGRSAARPSNEATRTAPRIDAPRGAPTRFENLMDRLAESNGSSPDRSSRRDRMGPHEDVVPSGSSAPPSAPTPADATSTPVKTGSTPRAARGLGGLLADEFGVDHETPELGDADRANLIDYTDGHGRPLKPSGSWSGKQAGAAGAVVEAIAGAVASWHEKEQIRQPLRRLQKELEKATGKKAPKAEIGNGGDALLDLTDAQTRSRLEVMKQRIAAIRDNVRKSTGNGPQGWSQFAQKMRWAMADLRPELLDILRDARIDPAAAKAGKPLEVETRVASGVHMSDLVQWQHPDFGHIWIKPHASGGPAISFAEYPANEIDVLHYGKGSYRFSHKSGKVAGILTLRKNGSIDVTWQRSGESAQTVEKARKVKGSAFATRWSGVEK